MGRDGWSGASNWASGAWSKQWEEMAGQVLVTEPLVRGAKMVWSGASN